VLFLVNILKTAMSARLSVINHQTSAFVLLLAEVSLYYSAIFVRKVWFCSLVRGTLATLLIFTRLVFERCAIK